MYRLLVPLALLFSISACAAKKPQVISCRAVYLKANSDKPEVKGKWHKGLDECRALMLGLAVANTPVPDERREVQFKDASDDELLDLGWYYRRLRKQLAPSIEDELRKERKL